MMFDIVSSQGKAAFLIEKESFEGIRIIGRTVAADIEAVRGQKPEI